MIHYDVPLVRQEHSTWLANSCWFASLLMLLRYHGVNNFGDEDTAGAAQSVGNATANLRARDEPISLSEFYTVKREVNQTVGKKLKYIRLVNFDGLTGAQLEKLLTYYGPFVCGGLFASSPRSTTNDLDTGHYITVRGYEDGQVHYNDPLGRDNEVLTFAEFKKLLFNNKINFARETKQMRANIYENRYNFMYFKH